MTISKPEKSDESGVQPVVNRPQAAHDARCEIYSELAGHLEIIIDGYNPIERREARKISARLRRMSGRPFGA